MIIKRIDIINYGKWHRVTVSLQRGLNILYGRNEAGKTTLLSFIKGVLFGYLQRRTSHKNYIPRNSKNYGGQLEVSVNGHDYIIKRMAGKNGGLVTILNGHGNRLDNSILRKILGPFDRNTFDALYYFGTVNLKLMGKLKQRDLIYRIQRIGLAHSNDWINYRETLAKQAKKLYSPRGYKPVLNQKLKQYSKLMNQVNEAKLSYRTYQELLRKIQQLRQEQQDIKGQVRTQSQRVDQLNQDQNTWARYQKMVSLKKFKAEPVLSGFTSKDAARLQVLDDRLRHIQSQSELVQQQIDEAAAQRIDDDLIDYYQQHQQRSNQLAERFNSVQNQLERLRLLKRSYNNVQNRLKYLTSKYAFNGHRLIPLSQDDYSSVNHISKEFNDSQQRLRCLTQRLATFQSHTRFQITAKDYLIYGIGILLVVMGLIITIPLSVVGVILCGGWFVYQNRQLRGQRRHLNQISQLINAQQGKLNKCNRNIYVYQNKYQYPTRSIERWLGMQDELKHMVSLQKEIKSLGRKKKQLTNYLNAYFKQWSFINRQLTLSSGYLGQLRQLENYVDKMERTVKINRQADSRRYKYLKRLKSIQDRQRLDHEKLVAFYRARHVKDGHEFRARQRQQEKLIQQRQLYDELSKQIGSSEINVLKRYRTYANLKNLDGQVNQMIDKLQSRSRKIDSQKAATQARLHQLVRNGSYDELQQRVANVRTEINGLVKNWLEKILASHWINATLNLATKGRVPKIERQAQVNFRILTDQRYSSIVFNKTKIKVMRKDKQRFTLYELSKGTVQQLYLALVFAMAQVFRSDYPMPILIDDGFTDFDVVRRKAAIKLLKSIGQKLQVIYCTSDENLVDQSVINLNQL